MYHRQRERERVEKNEYKVRNEWPQEERKEEMRRADGGQMIVCPLRGRRHDEDKEALREVRAAERGEM